MRTTNPFVCWHGDDDMPGADAPRQNQVPNAFSVEGAAETYASRIHADSDYFEEAIIMVRDPNGMVHRVEVTVEAVPSFSARVLP